MKLHARTLGQGYPTITLHGLFGSLENLGMVNRILADHFCMHALDLRNHGQSPHAQEMSYYLMAEDVIEYANENGLDQFNLIGHSMGGKVAMEIALREPSRVNRLAVIDMAPIKYPMSINQTIIDGFTAINLASIKSREDATKILGAYVPNTEVQLFLLKNLFQKKPGEFAWRINIKSIRENFDKLLDNPTIDYIFKKPSLFIKGELSNYLATEHEQAVLKFFPNAEIKTMPNVGHWLHAQNPKLTNQWLLDYLISR